MTDAWFEKRKRWILAGVFAFAVFISFFCLTQNPPSWFDEGIYHQIVRNIANHRIAGLFLTPLTHTDLSMISVGYPVLYPAAVAIALFGDSLLVLRLVAMAFLFGFLAVCYLLAKRLYGTRSALFSASLLATFSPLYGHGKNFLGEVPGLLYLVSGLYLLTRWEDDRKRTVAAMFLAGVFLGLAAASKPTYLVILPAVAIGLAWHWRQYCKDRRSRFACAALVGGGVLALLAWIATQFGGSFSPTRVLAHYSNPYYIKNFSPIVFHNLQRFVTETTPAHFLLLFVISIFCVVKQWRARMSLRMAEVVICVFILLLLVFYARTTGWYRYFFPAHALLFLFFPEGVLALSSWIGGALRAHASRVLQISVLLLGCIHLIPLIQERFRCAQDAPTALEPTLAAFPVNEPILFSSVPQIAARYRGSAMYQYIRMSDFLALGEENLRLAQSGFFARILREDRARVAFPRCYETAEIIHGIRILQKNPRVSCRADDI